MQSLQPDAVLTSLEPDLPYFINPQGLRSMEEEYAEFVKRGGKGSEFFLKPDPKELSQLVLFSSKLESFYRGVILREKRHFSVSSNLIFTKKETSEEKEVDCLWSPLYHCYSKEVPLVFAGYPYFHWLNLASKTIDHNAFSSAIKSLTGSSTAFASLQQALRSRFRDVFEISGRHSAEVVFKASRFFPKMVFVAEGDLAPLIASKLDSFSQDQALGLSRLLAASKAAPSNLAISEYAFNLFYLDFARYALLEKYFARSERFPFALEDKVKFGETLPGIFKTFWEDFEQKSEKVFGKVRPRDEDRMNGPAKQ